MLDIYDREGDGRGHEQVASDRGQGAIFSVEYRPGRRWIATVRSMGMWHEVLAARTYQTREAAHRGLDDLKRRLVENPGPVDAVLAAWGRKEKP